MKFCFRNNNPTFSSKMLSRSLLTSNLTKSLRLCNWIGAQSLSGQTSAKENSGEFQADETHFGFQKIKESEKVDKGEKAKSPF
jgi:hypothetical protein